MTTIKLTQVRTTLWLAMCACAVVVAVLNSRFLWMNIRGIFHHSLEHLGQRDFSLFLHLYTSPVILVVGALMFHRGFRQRFPYIHRWTGRVYVVTILVTSVATLHLSFHQTDGPMVALSFATLSVLWFATAAMAWTRARQGRYVEHSAWMVRNYALTLTNVTFRLELHALLLLGADIDIVYEFVRAMQPIPNLIVAELLIRTDFFGSDTWKQWWMRVRRFWGRRSAAVPSNLPFPAQPRSLALAPMETPRHE